MVRLLKNLLKVAIVTAIFFLVIWLWPKPIHHGPGVLVEEDPAQTETIPFSLGSVEGFELKALALYQIKSRILHTKRYYSAFGSKLVPYDVAIGWGPMSDETVLDRLNISQSNRFFFYEWQGAAPIPQSEIMRHASNMHLIAATPEIAKAIKRLRIGEVVNMTGYLVEATSPKGSWKSSLRRDDTGNGACELFYVDRLESCSTAF